MLRAFDLDRPWYHKAIELLPGVISGQVAELGAGNGELVQLLGKRIRFWTLVDIVKKPGMIQADFNQPLPFKPHGFSGVISLEVIEHLINYELFLREACRILKPDGWFIISTPNIAWWGYRLFSLLGQPPKKEGYHLRFFTHHSFILALNRAGFRLVKTNSFTTIPFINRWLPKPVYPTIRFWPNLLAQDLVFLCQKK